jgi:beta-lactamase superfamily II metal-dependent hydrolase
VPGTKVHAETSGECRITTFDVGHGDAILLDWQSGNGRWTALIDGGQHPEPLASHLQAADLTSLDLVVGTHPDTDHIQGLLGIPDGFPVGQYWGPPVAAFERYAWLFGARSAAAISRCREVERRMQSLGAAVLYPLDGYGARPSVGDGLTINVLSPPPQLMRTLLVADDISWLLTGVTTPFGWMLEPNREPMQEERAEWARLDAALRTGALSPEGIADLPRRPVARDTEPEQLAQEWARATGASAELFGDPLLNNSSIVLWVEVQTGHRRHRLLLPGDLENWTYLFATRSMGLQADVVKASHHGGRLHLEDALAADEFFSFVRPQVVLISANGSHDLPRTTTRDSAMRWGASVFCTQCRHLEFVSGDGGADACCYRRFACGCGGDVTLTLSADGIISSKQACHTGYGKRMGPVIQLRHHVVEPSPIVHRLFENELRKYVRWTKAALKRIHDNRKTISDMPSLGSDAVPRHQIAALAAEQGIHTLVPHIDTVLSEGMSRREFWAADASRYAAPPAAYHWLTRDEVREFLQTLGNVALIICPLAYNPRVTDRDTFLSSMGHSGLELYAEGHTKLPRTAFREVLWPAVLGRLRKWHCYQHDNGLVGLSLSRSAKDLYRQLLLGFRAPSYATEKDQLQLPTVETENELCSVPIIVNDIPKKDWDSHVGLWKEHVSRWFTFNGRALGDTEWQDAPRSSWGGTLWKLGQAEVWGDKASSGAYETNYKVEGYMHTTNDALDDIASLVCSSVNQIW